MSSLDDKNVNVNPSEKNIISLSPPDIRFTQDTIKKRLSDGRRLNDLLEDLKAGRLTTEDFEMIEVYYDEENGIWMSPNNRRLYLFKEYHKVKNIKIKAKIIYQLDPGKYTTKNKGTSVQFKNEKDKKLMKEKKKNRKKIK